MTPKNFTSTSIGKKQIVAITGLALILFLIGHLAGNLFIFMGPEAFNGYAKKLVGLRPGLYFIEFGLALIFFIHIYFTAAIVRENIKARGQSYAVTNPKGNRKLSTKIMPFTGFVIFAFVIYHLMDFTFTDHHGVNSILSDGESYGLYGVVYNAFQDPFHSLFYILAMFCIAFHLNHGIESFFQTYGLNHPKYFSKIQTASRALALIIAGGFSAIPLCIYFGVI